MINIDGHYVTNGDKNVFVKVLGEGKPAVLFEPDMGGLSVEWAEIQTKVAEFTTTISYDRPGYAESPVSDKMRTAPAVATELYNALTNSNVQEPYIIVGHGYGGLLAQLFAKMHPRDAYALVLVDPITQFDSELEEMDLPKYKEIASLEARMNNIRKYLDIDKNEFEKQMIPMLNELYKDLDSEFKNILTTYQSDLKFYKTIITEFDSLKESLELFKDIPANPDLPVKILARDFELMLDFGKQIGLPEEEAKAVEEQRIKSLKSLVGLYPQSELSIVKGANQSMQYTRPDAIVAAIKELVDKFELQ
jgi:pimeloyl-ACP methyl ester carboxylesterase